MNDNKDNNRLEIPSSGMMVRENYELVQLMDCCIYVLPSNNNLCEELVQKNFDKLLSSSDTLLNHYDVDFLEELPCMDNHPNLNSALAMRRYNLILGMNEPGSASGKQYLLLQSSDSCIDTDMAAMLKVSEQITSESVKQLMFRHAMISHESFIRSTEHIWESDGFWKNFIARRFGELLGGGLIGIVPSFRGGLGIDEILTHRKKMEMQKNFVNNIITLKSNLNDEKAMSEVKAVLDSIGMGNQGLIEYLRKIPENLIVQFYEELSPIKIAEHSNMKMEIRWVGRTNVKSPTDGKYRLYLHKDGKELPVHFKRKPSFVLYLIYLMDIYKSENVDTLNIRNDYENTFCTLYDKVYYCGGANSFKTMFGKGSSEQELLRHYLSDIRISVGNACEALHEAAMPYILNDANSHLCILKRNLIIDKRLTMPMTA